MRLLTDCPDRQQMHRLLLGQLNPCESEGLEQHALECDSCLRAMRTVPADDGLVAALRAVPVADDYYGHPVVQSLIGHLKGLLPAADRPPEEDTMVKSAGPWQEDEAAASGEIPGREPAPVAYPFLAPPLRAGELGRLGHYRVLKVVGVGGMGIVFHAVDPDLERPVALKVMQPQLAAIAEARERFLREARAAAALRHDRVAVVYQVGEDRGTPFLAMELLKGESLEQRLSHGRRPTLPEVLRLGQEIAAGLAAAHERGLIHRDVKPANIWLEGATARVKLLDFGLVRAVGQQLNSTRQGTIVGTPAYMAPEQATGAAVGPRCDLFSLGCILYRLCTGQPPFGGNTPLAVMAALTTQTPRPVREISPETPAALADLIQQLLARDPAQRPDSAQAVEQRLRAIEQDLAAPATAAAPAAAVYTPDLAAPAKADSSGCSGAKGPVAARPRRLLAFLMAVAAGVLLLVGGALWLAPQLIESGNPKSPLGGSADRSREGPSVVPSGAPLSSDALVVHPAALKGVQSWTLETIGHRGPVSGMAYRPDGTRLVSWGVDATLRIWDTKTSRLPQMIVHPRALALTPGGEPGPSAVAWSPDGKILAVCADHRVWLWNADTGQLLRKLLTNGCNLAFSPDGKTLAAGATELGLWDVATGERVAVLERSVAGPVPADPVWSPDGKLLAASTGQHSAIEVWKVASGKSEAMLQPKDGVGYGSLAWAPDSKSLAFVSGGRVCRWAPTTTEVRSLGPTNWGRPQWLSGGTTLACGADRWDVISGKHTRADVGDQNKERAPLAAITWAPDGKTFACLFGATTLEIRDGATGQVLQALPRGHLQSPGWPTAWSPNGRFLAFNDQTAAYDPHVAVAVWDMANLTPYCRLQRGHAGGDTRRGLVWSADGKFVFVSGIQFDIPSRRYVGELAADRFGLGSAPSPDGRMLAVGCGREVLLYNLKTQQAATPFKGRKLPAKVVAWSPDGRLLASGGADEGSGEVAVWEVKTGKLLWIGEHKNDVLLAWSPDGTLLASGGWSRGEPTTKLWERASGKLLQTLPVLVGGLTWSADSKTLITADGETSLGFWDVGTGRQIRTQKLTNAGRLIPEHQGAAFSPNGRLLATNHHKHPNAGGKMLIWNVATGQLLVTLLPLRLGHGLTLTPEGHYRGTRNVGRELVYVVETDRGQETLSPSQFTNRYEWENNPQRVQLPD